MPPTDHTSDRRRPAPPIEYAVVGNLTNGTQIVFQRNLTRRDAGRSAARYRRLVAHYTSVPVLSVDVWAMRAVALARPAAAMDGVE